MDTDCSAFGSAEKKWRLFRAWASGHPVWCAWQVTYRCNFRCRFCHYWRDPLARTAEPTVPDYAAGARKLASLGTLMISLAGGEPLLRSDVPQIVEAIGRYHFPFVTTNGWFVTPDVARELMQAGVWGVSISIDYARPERHDARRGVEGAWEQAWRAVELLSAARVRRFQRVNVIAVLMDDNLEDMEGLLAMAARRGAYFMVQPYGSLKTGTGAYQHGNGRVSTRLLELRRRWPNFLSNPHYLSRFDDFLAGGVCGCQAGRAFFNIDSTGDIAICVERRATPVANLHRHSIRTIVRHLRAGARGNACTGCWYNCRGEIESLYRPLGLLKSLPTLLFDRGRARGGTDGGGGKPHHAFAPGGPIAYNAGIEVPARCRPEKER
jgi:MoaA/NifB/PqqE/SkfB family radical SAM enzyme